MESEELIGEFRQPLEQVDAQGGQQVQEKGKSMVTPNRLLPATTLFVCFLTILAYEAVKIHGSHHSLCFEGCRRNFVELIMSDWEGGAIFVYMLILSPFFSVLSRKYSNKGKLAWLGAAIVSLCVTCMNISGSRIGRWDSTAEWIALSYFLFLSVPAFVLFVSLKSIKPSGNDKQDGTQ